MEWTRIPFIAGPKASKPPTWSVRRHWNVNTWPARAARVARAFFCSAFSSLDLLCLSSFSRVYKFDQNAHPGHKTSAARWKSSSTAGEALKFRSKLENLIESISEVSCRVWNDDNVSIGSLTWWDPEELAIAEAPLVSLTFQKKKVCQFGSGMIACLNLTWTLDTRIFKKSGTDLPDRYYKNLIIVNRLSERMHMVPHSFDFTKSWIFALWHYTRTHACE